MRPNSHELRRCRPSPPEHAWSEEVIPIERFDVAFTITERNHAAMDLSQVTLAQMRYAIAVSEAENFRLAAERSHVSQSGLSMQIQKLEELLGLVLFDRSKKPVKETDDGRAALKQMRSILRETERLGQIVAEESEPAGPYRLGVIPTLSPSVLPLFLGNFTRKYPRVELILEELKTTDMIASLQADTLDAGLAATPLHVPGLYEEPLGLETMYAYLPPGDALLKKKSISQENLQTRKLWVMPEGHCFRSQVLAYCGNNGASRQGPLRFESGSFQTLMSLVDDGLGATVIPALVAEGLSKQRRADQLRPLSAPTPTREIGLVRARQDLRRRVTEALAIEIRTALSKVLPRTPKSAVVLEPL
jgi:LysR family transcriptional regulator, hydrogen peroxide-inducible genes activator